MAGSRFSSKKVIKWGVGLFALTYLALLVLTATGVIASALGTGAIVTGLGTTLTLLSFSASIGGLLFATAALLIPIAFLGFVAYKLVKWSPDQANKNDRNDNSIWVKLVKRLFSTKNDDKNKRRAALIILAILGTLLPIATVTIFGATIGIGLAAFAGIGVAAVLGVVVLGVALFKGFSVLAQKWHEWLAIRRNKQDISLLMRLLNNFMADKTYEAFVHYVLQHHKEMTNENGSIDSNKLVTFMQKKANRFSVVRKLIDNLGENRDRQRLLNSFAGAFINYTLEKRLKLFRDTYRELKSLLGGDSKPAKEKLLAFLVYIQNKTYLSMKTSVKRLEEEFKGWLKEHDTKNVIESSFTALLGNSAENKPVVKLTDDGGKAQLAREYIILSLQEWEKKKADDKLRKAYRAFLTHVEEKKPKFINLLVSTIDEVADNETVINSLEKIFKRWLKEGGNTYANLFNYDNSKKIAEKVYILQKLVYKQGFKGIPKKVTALSLNDTDEKLANNLHQDVKEGLVAFIEHVNGEANAYNTRTTESVAMNNSDDLANQFKKWLKDKKGGSTYLESMNEYFLYSIDKNRTLTADDNDKVAHKVRQTIMAQLKKARLLGLLEMKKGLERKSSFLEENDYKLSESLPKTSGDSGREACRYDHIPYQTDK